MRQDWVVVVVVVVGGGGLLAAHHLFPASIPPLWNLKRSTLLCFPIPTTLKGPF